MALESLRALDDEGRALLGLLRAPAHRLKRVESSRFGARFLQLFLAALRSRATAQALAGDEIRSTNRSLELWEFYDRVKTVAISISNLLGLDWAE
jgi:hypothetical protein